MNMKEWLLAAVAGVAVGCTPQTEQAFLPSWNETPIKQELKSYIQTGILSTSV